MSKVIFDLDDYCDEYNCLPELLELKKEIPNMKVTLFTIPAKTSQKLLDETKKYDWIQMAVHGFNHATNYEFAFVGYNNAKEMILGSYKEGYYVKGFKAPGWQINTEVMKALKDLGFWLAVQWKDGRFYGDPNGPYQPQVIEGLKCYAFRERENAIHGHTWLTCGNGLSQIKSNLLEYKDSEFEFINNII